MKNISFLLVISALALFSCNEIMPTIPPLSDGSTEPVPIDTVFRKVLLEEFTGVGCVQCPGGSATIENLLLSFPNNLVAISIHTGNFARERNWHPDQKYDFRTTDGDNLTSSIFGGEPFAYPSASVNREKTNTNTFFRVENEWAVVVEDEIKTPAAAAINITHSFDETSRELGIDLEIIPLEIVPADVRVTVIITENNIIDYQKDVNAPGDGWVQDYKHKHVLRDIVTAFDGDIISPNGLTPSTTEELSFSATIPNEWDANNCDIIAFIHRNTADSREVLQAEEAHILD